MAVFTQPIDFVSLYGTDGMGWLVGVRDNTTDLAARKNAVNMAYVELAGLIKGYWRRRSYDYTSGSTVPLVAGTRAYSVPTTTGAVFDSMGRLYYRSAGTVVDVPVLGDAEWLEKSTTRSTDVGFPDYARVVQTSSAVNIELNRPVSQTFIDQIATLTLEYHIAIAHLSNDTDTTVLPRNHVQLIIPVAAWWYALTQGDDALADRLKPECERAKATLMRQDLTRTGRPRRLRPTHSYTGQGGIRVKRDYGQ